MMMMMMIMIMMMIIIIIIISSSLGTSIIKKCSNFLKRYGNYNYPLLKN